MIKQRDCVTETRTHPDGLGWGWGWGGNKNRAAPKFKQKKKIGYLRFTAKAILCILGTKQETAVA